MVRYKELDHEGECLTPDPVIQRTTGHSTALSCFQSVILANWGREESGGDVPLRQLGFLSLLCGGELCHWTPVGRAR